MRHRGYRPDAELECQRRDEKCARRAASHDRASDRRHHRHEFLGGPFSNTMGAGLCVVQVGDPLLCPDVRRQVFKYGIRVGSNSPRPVISALLADWPPEKLKEAKESGGLLEASEVANVVTFMLTRPRGMRIRDVVSCCPLISIFRRHPLRKGVRKSRTAVSQNPFALRSTRFCH